MRNSEARAVRREGELQYLIEVKAIGRDLRENQLKQAVDYEANQGVEWVLLTNGAEWQAHRIRFEQPISSDLVFTANLIDDNTPTSELLERLYLISKEAGRVGEIDRYFKQREATSRYVLAQLLLAPTTVAFVRRQLRGLFQGVKIDDAALERILQEEVLKRDVLEGDKAVEASKRVRRATRRRERVKAQEVAAADSDGKADVRDTLPRRRQAVDQRPPQPETPADRMEPFRVVGVSQEFFSGGARFSSESDSGEQR